MSALDDLPPLRDVIRRHGLSAQKSLGQNFLLDLNLTGRIARASGPLEDVTVVEVGPGPGGLTRALLALGAKRVIAIERDMRCMDALAEVAAHYPGRLEVIEGDALKVDVRPLIGEGEARVVANLPYNIATVLLVGWLSTDPWPPWFSSLTLMFQKEVAERIVARPGGKAYGRLAVLAQWRSDAKIVMTLPPEAFVPAPKVHSSVVHLTALPEPRYPADAAVLNRVVAAGFNQRRKMLRASLKGLHPAIEDLLIEAGIAPTARAEEIGLEQFCALARLLAAAPR